MNTSIKITLKAVISAIAVLTSMSASAGFVLPDLIDFNITSLNGGSMVWDSATDRILGSNIAIDSVVSQTLPGLVPVVGPMACSGCVLSFATGTHTTGTDFNGNLLGSSIRITQGNAVLMSGKFISGSVMNLNKMFNILGAGFVDVKDTVFAQSLGFFSPNITGWEGGLNLQFAATSGFKQNARLSVLSGDVTNTPVPVPAAAWLLGSGLIGLVGVSRRKIASV